MYVRALKRAYEQGEHNQDREKLKNQGGGKEASWLASGSNLVGNGRGAAPSDNDNE